MTATEHHILTREGLVNPGMAKRIAIDEYDPSAETFERLIKDGALAFNKKPKQTLYVVLTAMVQALLNYLLEHREDFR